WADVMHGARGMVHRARRWAEADAGSAGPRLPAGREGGLRRRVVPGGAGRGVAA
ncbi:MAG: hypothetical protein AVDCRST_MAG08-4270, partial [uncultured Acetobacteraceae bacterium]